MVLIHSYLTNGKILVDFAQEFLRSLKKFSGEHFDVMFVGKDLSTSQINSLKKIYKNLTCFNMIIFFLFIMFYIL